MFELACPLALLLLPLPYGVWYYFTKPVNTTRTAIRLPSIERYQSLIQTTKLTSSRLTWPKILLIVSWVLLVFAASAPQWVGQPISQKQSGRDIMLALDISGSMEIPDMSLDGDKVDRLTLVKNVARTFVKKRTEDRLGLILFGSHAYLQTPLTFDKKTVLAMIDDASIGLAGAQTAMGDAVGLAIKHLKQTSPQSRVLILLTDGANNSGAVQPLPAAKMAADENIKIYTVGIGADQMVLRSFMGQEIIDPSADLDEDTLKKIASLSGGQFFRAKNSEELNAVYDQIDSLEPIDSQSKLIRPISPLYPYPLVLACALILLLALRKSRYSDNAAFDREEMNSGERI